MRRMEGLGMTTRRIDIGGIVFGLIVLGVGLWFLLENTFAVTLPELDWDKIWPVLVIVLGVAIVLGAWTRRETRHTPQP